MPTPADVIAYLAKAGLNPAEVMQVGYRLQHGEAPDGISAKAADAIDMIGNAGLDDAGVKRTFNYLSTGQDPEGDQERAAAAQQAAQPARVIAEDPAYLAYQRALGVEDASDNEATTSRSEAMQRALGDQLANLTGQGDVARRNISGGLEARGLLRSGEHERDLADQRTAEGQQASALQATTASQVSDLQQQLAQRRAARQRQGAEQGLNTANNLYVS